MYRAKQDRSASPCRLFRGGMRNAADEHGKPKDRRENGNVFLDLKLAGEPDDSETCMSGSGEGSWKSAER